MKTASRPILGLALLITSATCLQACGGAVGGADREASTGGDPGVGGNRASGGTGATASGGASGSGGSVGTGGTTMTRREPAEHRPRAASCVGVHDPPEPVITSEYSECITHADCTDGVNGKCVTGIGMAWSTGFCDYDQCATDADCDPGMVCYCSASDSARCLWTGNCLTDADCGAGNYCSPSMGTDCGGYHSIDGFHCHTAGDTCSDDADCTGDREYCDYDEYGNRWECVSPDDGCAIG